MKRYLIILGFIFFCFLPASVGAQTPTLEPPSTDSPKPTKQPEPSGNADVDAELKRKKREYEEKLKQLSSQKNTLSSQIDYMDTQIYLTELKTQQTEKQIAQAEKEIDSMSNRIESLDSSLDHLSRTLIDRVVDGYKQRRVTLFDMILDSENANDLLGRVKYQKTAQENNQKVLFQVQQTKSNFQDMKLLREKKKRDLDRYKDILTTQRAELLAQQTQKQRLLEVTQNDEKVYQNLLAEANRQIESYKSFVQSSGVSVISAGALGEGEGGWYLSQRDARWAGVTMGNSSETILNVGCFITSIAMVFRSYGYDVTPVTLASDEKFFVPRTAYMYHPSRFNGGWPGGKNYRNITAADVPSYLSRNIPVIANVFAPSVPGGEHYIVLKKQEGGDYIMNDPIYGPDKKVSDYYTLRGVYAVFD
ncbi:MAG: C39 family peptidase [Patescibacteria group bacterium]|nr:C39 family peptidase [Patescibacteria group bacterium]